MRKFRVAFSHTKCSKTGCDEADRSAVHKVLETVCKSRGVDYEYFDWEVNRLSLNSKDEIRKYFLEEADLAVFLLEKEFGKEQRMGYGEILKRRSPEMLVYVLIREDHKEEDTALLEEARKFKVDDGRELEPYVYDFRETKDLRGAFLNDLERAVERFKESQEVRDVTETESGVADNPQEEDIPTVAEPPVSTHPEGGASSANPGRKQGRGNAIAVIAAIAVFLALLACVLALDYRAKISEMWYGRRTDSNEVSDAATNPETKQKYGISELKKLTEGPKDNGKDPIERVSGNVKKEKRTTAEVEEPHRFEVITGSDKDEGVVEEQKDVVEDAARAISKEPVAESFALSIGDNIEVVPGKKETIVWLSSNGKSGYVLYGDDHRMQSRFLNGEDIALDFDGAVYPTIEELSEIYEHRDAIGIRSGIYRSGTKAGRNEHYALDFSTGKKAAVKDKRTDIYNMLIRRFVR